MTYVQIDRASDDRPLYRRALEQIMRSCYAPTVTVSNLKLCLFIAIDALNNHSEFSIFFSRGVVSSF